MQRAVNNQVGQLLTGSLLNNSMEAKNAQIPSETRPSAIGMSDPIWGPLILFFVDDKKKCEG